MQENKNQKKKNSNAFEYAIFSFGLKGRTTMQLFEKQLKRVGESELKVANNFHLYA